MATQTVGFDIDLTKGTHSGTTYADGVLKLIPQGDLFSEAGGYWISDVIDLKDSFTVYDNVVINRSETNAATVVISTSTSADGSTFDEFAALSMSNKIESTKRRYIKVKIELFPGYTEAILSASDFNAEEEAKFTNTAFLAFDGTLSLRKSYAEQMSIDSSWAESGTLLRKAINLDAFKKIDTVGVK